MDEKLSDVLSEGEREYFHKIAGFDPHSDRIDIEGQYNWRYECIIQSDEGITLRFGKALLTGFVEYNTEGIIRVGIDICLKNKTINLVCNTIEKDGDFDDCELSQFSSFIKPYEHASRHCTPWYIFALLKMYLEETFISTWKNIAYTDMLDKDLHPILHYLDLYQFPLRFFDALEREDRYSFSVWISETAFELSDILELTEIDIFLRWVRENDFYFTDIECIEMFARVAGKRYFHYGVNDKGECRILGETELYARKPIPLLSQIGDFGFTMNAQNRVTSLCLADSGIRVLSVLTKKLKYLAYIDLSNNHLSYGLQWFLSDLPELKILKLRNTHPGDGYRFIEGLRRLESLDISGNDLKNIPEEVGTLNLKELCIDTYLEQDPVIDILKQKGCGIIFCS